MFWLLFTSLAATFPSLLFALYTPATLTLIPVCARPHHTTKPLHMASLLHLINYLSHILVFIDPLL